MQSLGQRNSLETRPHRLKLEDEPGGLRQRWQLNPTKSIQDRKRKAEVKPHFTQIIKKSTEICQKEKVTTVSMFPKNTEAKKKNVHKE